MGISLPPDTQLEEAGIRYFLSLRISLVAKLVKNPPAMLETWVQPLGWEDPLEKEMATHFSIPAYRIPSRQEPGVLYGLWGCKELDMTE